MVQGFDGLYDQCVKRYLLHKLATVVECGQEFKIPVTSKKSDACSIVCAVKWDLAIK
jgi:hypothetical protein